MQKQKHVPRFEEQTIELLSGHFELGYPVM